MFTIALTAVMYNKHKVDSFISIRFNYTIYDMISNLIIGIIYQYFSHFGTFMFK